LSDKNQKTKTTVAKSNGIGPEIMDDPLEIILCSYTPIRDYFIKDPNKFEVSK
jgi:hypothetical protein